MLSWIRVAIKESSLQKQVHKMKIKIGTHKKNNSTGLKKPARNDKSPKFTIRKHFFASPGMSKTVI